MSGCRSLLIVPTLLAILVGLWSHEPVLAVGWSSIHQEKRSLTPLQLEIEKQVQRLSAAEVEERRDALMRLSALRHPSASRAAANGLTDNAPIVRATATSAVLSLPPEESATLLIPLLNDKDEFVRQEAAYALGKTQSRSAVESLIERLLQDKKPGVRGAAAVALGQIRGEAAAPYLAKVLSPATPLPTSTRIKVKTPREQNAFVLRAAARSLGQIGDRNGVPALAEVLHNEKAPSDLRREAAFALGTIGDRRAIQALQQVLDAQDPYLAQAAHQAIRRISNRASQ